jgi:hypothetical protein
MAVASGGKCGQGAASGAIGAAGSPVIATYLPDFKTDPAQFVAGAAISAGLGGLASVASGGKFVTGAETAAFGYLYNAAVADAMGLWGGRLAAAAAVESGPIGVIGAGLAGRAIGRAAGTWIEDWLANSANPPDIPDKIIGDNPKPASGSGSRVNTDRPAGSFAGTVEELTGGQLTPDPDRPGHLCCSNGVRVRPSSQGPRIDVPANGPKPHETIHFPGAKWPY